MPAAMPPKSLTFLRITLSILFVLSGFAGLIYQSVWTQYLGLLLGHAAYAQALVLAIFMGGMAGGAWLAAKYSSRWRRLLLGYALCELIIGVAGLLFHGIFGFASALTLESVLPAIAPLGLVPLWQYSLAALLILPQCLLLGATFPLLSAALVRIAPDQLGSTLGGLYFANSIGAAIGVLIAAFVLVPAVGLPGSLVTAGLVSVLVGLAALALDPRTQSGQQVDQSQDSQAGDPVLLKLLLICTLLSGGFSFVYEIGWIRLLNQALGSSVHSFELMLAAFILGLALGGRWVRRRGDALQDAVAVAGYAQVYMGMAALLSLICFAFSFDAVGWLMQALSRSSEGYNLYLLGSAAVAIVVMLPAAFFAGMTLPLFTMALLRDGHGERAIGKVYAANTVGAIFGVALAVFVLIPLVGVTLALTIAALGDILVGLFILRRISPARTTPGYITVALSAALAVLLSVQFGRPAPEAQVSGVFRGGQARLNPDLEVHYLRDGRTATVAVYADKERTTGTIVTNGKPDASLRLDPSSLPMDDEVTMVMLGVLPGLLHPDPKDVAVIGWGSGMSTHTLLGDSRVASVETVEIERAMWEGAKLFGQRVIRAYEDPRSRVYFDDARTHFASTGRQYDLIVSEPSNPWVNGVASLFTQEFYSSLKPHLKDGGVFGQWLHTYEISDPLVATMMSALLDTFAHVRLYEISYGDMVLIASDSPLGQERMEMFGDGALRAEARRVGLRTPADFGLRVLGEREVLQIFVRIMGAEPHSDFYPEVTHKAPKDRYLRQSSSFLPDTVWSGLPVMDILQGLQPPGRETDFTPNPISTILHRRDRALQWRDALISDRPAPLDDTDDNAMLAMLRQLGEVAQPSQTQANQWLESAAALAQMTLGHLPARDLQEAWIQPAWVGRIQDERIQAMLDVYAAAAARDLPALRAAVDQARIVHAQSPLPAQSLAQVLVMDMALHARNGDHPAARAADNALGQQAAGHYGSTRAFLLAWADQDQG